MRPQIYKGLNSAMKEAIFYTESAIILETINADRY